MQYIACHCLLPQSMHTPWYGVIQGLSSLLLHHSSRWLDFVLAITVVCEPSSITPQYISTDGHATGRTAPAAGPPVPSGLAPCLAALVIVNKWTDAGQVLAYPASIVLCSRRPT